MPRPLLETRPPDTGYEITFSDFRRLLADADNETTVAALLREWFGYQLKLVRGSVRIVTRDGAEIDELAVHQRIQNDPSKQSALYRAAMTLWR
jgi:hypothetical protein